MGLLVMILGLVLFLGVHTLTTQRALRARLIAAWGEPGYKIGYALVSLLGLVLIVWGFADYRATGWIDLWHPPKVFKHITVALMLLGSGLFALEVGLHAALGVTPFVMLAPIGGTIAILGWLALIVTPQPEP